MKNPTLLQYFHWYYPDGGQLWPELAERAGGLNDIGINMVWLPPPIKARPAAIPLAMIPTICLIWANSTKREPSPPNTAIKTSCWRR